MQGEQQEALEVVAPRRNAFLVWIAVVLFAVRWASPADFRWSGAIVFLLCLSFPLVWRIIKRWK